MLARILSLCQIWFFFQTVFNLHSIQSVRGDSISDKGIPEEMRAVIEHLHNTCKAEIGLPEEMIQDAINGKFAQDPRLGCYMKCLMEQLGCIDDDGVIDQEAFVALVPQHFKEHAAMVFRECGHKVGSNACETVFLINECYYGLGPDDYFLI